MPLAPQLLRRLAWTATVAVGLLLVLPMPAGAEAVAPPGSDKLVHVLLFGALAVLWRWALAARSPRSALAIGAAVWLYGGALELVQALIPYRSCEWGDFLADGLGAGLGLALAWGVDLVRARRSPA